MKKKMVFLITFYLVISALTSCKGDNQVNYYSDSQNTISSENSSLTLADFDKIKLGMSYEQVIELIGEPNSSTGFGIVWYTYILNDEFYMKLLFVGENTTLIKMIKVDSDGKEYEMI